MLYTNASIIERGEREFGESELPNRHWGKDMQSLRNYEIGITKKFIGNLHNICAIFWEISKRGRGSHRPQTFHLFSGVAFQLKFIRWKRNYSELFCYQGDCWFKNSWTLWSCFKKEVINETIKTEEYKGPRKPDLVAESKKHKLQGKQPFFINLTKNILLVLFCFQKGSYFFLFFRYFHKRKHVIDN